MILTRSTISNYISRFYGIGPLVKRLTLCEEMDNSSCGDVLFHAYIPPPIPPPLAPTPPVTANTSGGPLKLGGKAAAITAGANGLLKKVGEEVRGCLLRWG